MNGILTEYQYFNDRIPSKWTPVDTYRLHKWLKAIKQYLPTDEKEQTTEDLARELFSN
jgi:hypothetical protein